MNLCSFIAYLAFSVFGTPTDTPSCAPTAVVWLHGGGWSGVAPAEFDWTADFFEDRGHIVFRPSYTLTGEASHPAQIHDVHRSILFASLVAEKVYVVGVSAGGHLASLAGTSWNDENLNPLPLKVRPDAIVNLAGPLDPVTWGNDIAFRYPQTPGGVAALLGSANPDVLKASTYIDKDDPPQTLVYSNGDSIVPWSTQKSEAHFIVNSVGGEIHVTEQDHTLSDAPVWWIDNWLRKQ